MKKIKVLIPINDYDSKSPPIAQEGQFAEIQMKSIRENEYECSGVQTYITDGGQWILRIFDKKFKGKTDEGTIAEFNWDKIIGYEVIRYGTEIKGW